MLTIICLRWGSAYVVEYVNRLHSMLRRNLAAPFRFVAISDDPLNLDNGIDFIRLPSDLEKWWGKLWMFKRGLFEDGTPMMFFDLDTVIVDDVTDIAAWRGQFATLRDFYRPAERLGPAIMAWEAGDYAGSIWQEWEAQGKPREKMGDLWWINNLDQGRFAKSATKLQDEFPGRFVSYKAQKCATRIPTGASVVCFHGEPKPHNCGSAWVADHWR